MTFYSLISEVMSVGSVCRLKSVLQILKNFGLKWSVFLPNYANMGSDLIWSVFGSKWSVLVCNLGKIGLCWSVF